MSPALRAGTRRCPSVVDAQRLECDERAGDVRPEQHPSARVQRDLRLNGNAITEVPEQSLESGDRSLDLEDVLRGLHEQHVDTALDQSLRLRVIRILER